MANTKGKGVRALVAGSVLQLFLGILYVWSVFVAPVSAHYGWEVDAVKLTSSYMLCCFVLGILLGGRLQVRLGTDNVALIGGLLMAGGMLATSFLPAGALWLLYVTYGVIGGLGVGMAYNAIITSAQRHFPHKRGMATGVSVCAFGFSTVVFAPLVEWLVGAVGLGNTFRILAAAFAVVSVGLFRFVALPEAGASGAAADFGGARQYTTGEILKTPTFYLIMVSMMFGTAAYFILNPSFKTLSAERGLSDAVGTGLVMLTGVANAAGRLVIPMLSEKIGRTGAAALIYALTAACAVLLSFAGGFVFLAAVAVIAFCYGGSSGVYPLITGDAFGLKNVGSNYGAVMVGFALSALLFPMIIGAIPGMFTRFIVLAAVAAAGAVLILLAGRKKQAGA